jgi:hypothetical protein
MTPEFVIGLAVFVWAMFDMWSDKWPRDLGHKVFAPMVAGLFATGLAHLIRIVVEGLGTMSGAGK